MNDEYRVNLDVYSGPLDLLLYLIRREEVDVYDIPIARITEQYMQYVEMIRRLDPNLAGDFLVLAATLMEIKTRMLLPASPPEEGAADGLAIDPRAELVRQLLEYKAFKDAAEELRGSAEEWALRFRRSPPEPQTPAGEVDLEDVQVWDLLDAFDRLMAAIGQKANLHEVIYDDTPIEMHAVDILDRLRTEGAMAFRRIFEGIVNRSEIIGLFLALLELVRQRKVLCTQDRNFGEIHIELNPDPPTDEQLRREEEQLQRRAAEMERAAAEAAKHAPPPPAEDAGPEDAGDEAEDAEEGLYVADLPEAGPQEQEGDEDSPETSGAGA